LEQKNTIRDPRTALLACPLRWCGANASDQQHPGNPGWRRSSMYVDSQRLKRVSGGLLLVSAVAFFAAVACSEIQPEPNVEEGGALEAPTHEQDALREEEQRQEEGGRR
jgi:hypothetical protein